MATTPRELDEFFTIANKAECPSEYLGAVIVNVPTGKYIRKYIDYAVSDSFPSFDVLNVGAKNDGYHRSLAGAQLLNRHVALQFDAIVSDTMPEPQKISAFKHLYSQLCTEEAELLILILTKNLASVYTNLTHEELCKV